MSEKFPTHARGLVSSAAGILGALALIAGNFIIMYAPMGEHYSLKALADIKSPNDIAVGISVIMIGGPLIFAGLYSVYLALRPSSVWLSLPPLLIFAYGLVQLIVKLVYSAVMILTYQGLAAQIAPIYITIYQNLDGNVYSFMYLGSIYMMVTLWWGETYYPKWASVGQPFILVFLIKILLVKPEPALTAFLAPNASVIPFLVFYILTFIVFSSKNWESNLNKIVHIRKNLTTKEETDAARR